VYKLENKFLNIKETSKFLKMSVSQINRLIKKGIIPSYKVEGRRLFDCDEIVEWVKYLLNKSHTEYLDTKSLESTVIESSDYGKITLFF
jgi:excisionase family DNA binding protein